MSTAWVRLAIITGSDPIEGTLYAGQHGPRPFRGWLELAAAIEAVRAGRIPAPDVRAKPGKD